LCTVVAYDKVASLDSPFVFTKNSVTEVVGKLVKPVFLIRPFVLLNLTTGNPLTIPVLYIGLKDAFGWVTSLAFPDPSVQVVISSPSDKLGILSDSNHNTLDVLFPTPPGPVWAKTSLPTNKTKTKTKHAFIYLNPNINWAEQNYQNNYSLL